MFQAGVIWKLWLISATVILGIQAIVDLSGTSGRAKLVRRAEIGNNALHRRAPKPQGAQTPISAQCVNSYNYHDPKKYPLKDGTVACMAAGHRPMVCSGKCEMRSNPDFQLPAPIPFGDFAYKDCGPDFGKSRDTPLTVHPKKFRAFNDLNIIYVQGWHDPKDQTTRLYDCSWFNPGATNNQRPWCDGCVDQFFEELPIKE